MRPRIVREYDQFRWTLPPTDPEMLLAGAVGLHYLFDGIFKAKTWLHSGASETDVRFAPIDLGRLDGRPLCLDACRALHASTAPGHERTINRGEHVITLGSADALAAVVDGCHPRTALAVDASTTSSIVTYVQQRGIVHDAGFPGLFERALRALAALAQSPTWGAVDITDTVRAALPAPAIARDETATARPPLFVERFSSIATQTPDRPAIVAGQARVTYGDLARLTDTMVHRWRHLPLTTGSRLLLIAPRGPALVAAVIAAFKAGFPVCLVDPRQPDGYVAGGVETVQPATIVNLTGRDLPLPDVPVVTEIDLGIDELSPAIRRDVFADDDCAIIGLTSGTTRAPKAVAGRYSSLTYFYDWMNDRFGPMNDAAFGMCSSIGHDPLQRDIMTPLYLGGCIVIPDERDVSDPRRLPRWLAENGIEVVCLNAALVPWLGTSAALPSLRLLFCVGAALTRAQAITLRRDAPGARIVNLYGATETQRAVGYYELPRGRTDLAGLPDVVPLGRGMKDVQLLVHAPSPGRLALPFQVGEIAIRSRHIALGYLDDAGLTARKFTHDSVSVSQLDDVPTYLTGDLGYMSMSHGVIFAGRADRQQKISGYRVELAALDDRCREHPGVQDAATIVVEIDGLPTLATFVVPAAAPGARCDLAELRHWLAERLPRYMVPHRLSVLPALPLNVNRKLDTHHLAALALSAAAPAAPAAHERAFLDIILTFIRRHTGTIDVSADVPLAALGIDSLRFAALVSELQGDPRVGLHRAATLHHEMSVADLVSALAARRADEPARRSRANGTSPLDLLGPVLDVTETMIRFARGTFDHCCSNSYLGLAARPALRAEISRFLEESRSVGAHGSVELNGFTSWHERLVTGIREIYGSEAALLYSSCYLANLSVIPALASNDAQLFLDESCHQSIVDGCRLSGAAMSVYRHNDADSLEQLLRTARPSSAAGTRLILTEGVFSLEGDLLDLPAVVAIARRYGCLLLVDEACSLGQMGVSGRGIEEHFGLPGSIDVRTGTLAKALGTNGGYVACSSAIAQRLRFQRGASLSTSLSPLNAFIAWQGTAILRSEGAALTARLARNAAVWRAALTSIGFRIGRSSTAIVPIMCDDDDGVAELFQQAIDREIYALPVSWPWSTRMHALRSSVTAAHDADRLREIAGRFASTPLRARTGAGR